MLGSLAAEEASTGGPTTTLPLEVCVGELSSKVVEVVIEAGVGVGVLVVDELVVSAEISAAIYIGWVSATVVPVVGSYIPSSTMSPTSSV